MTVYICMVVFLAFKILVVYKMPRASVAELVDAPDSKSGFGNGVWVRFPPEAPFCSSNFLEFANDKVN